MTIYEMYTFLMLTLNNPQGACAVLGNLKAESALRANNLQNSYNLKLGYTDESYTKAVDDGIYTNFAYDAAGYGLAQWTYKTRKLALLQYAKEKGKSIGDAQMQLSFLLKEMSGYPTVWKAVKTGTDIKEISDIVCKQYERPANQSPSALAVRSNYAKTIYRQVMLQSPAQEVTPENSIYYAVPSYDGSSFVDALKSLGVDSSFAHRKQIALANGFASYKGTAQQNKNLLTFLKQGLLIKA